ncbi:FecR family protein [Telluribacter sp. SYSU D00476]|uniref:FecR family protein n=1 Tax=Telluribacter sp. SYSU D00476 TaxID=2811430 RepID=UPI001FF63920|nr:FecR domain-containing protein [Telluribacter sp. SYSU D00476]
MEKQRYTHFSASDFLLDADFLAWVQGQAPESDQIWQQWLAEDPTMQAEIKKAKQLYAALSFREKKINSRQVDAEWEKMKLVFEYREVDMYPEETTGKKKVLPVLLRVAAAAALLLMVVWVGKGYLSAGGPGATAMMQREVANGQQLTIKLTDGTVIRLNAGSTLSYPEKFRSEKREVHLTGEAYFEVAPNPSAPFIIHTGDVQVRVVGTKFSVKAYPEGDEVKVAVVEGKVGVNTSAPASAQPGTAAQAEEVYLTPNEMATFEKENKEINVTSFDKAELLGWKDGILYFEKADFTEVVRKLERWYGVKIRIQSGKKVDPEWRFSGKFENKSIDYILDICSYPDRFTYEVTDREVIIH